MIDIEKCRKLFTEYTSDFDFRNEKINYKYDHTFRVAEFCRKIALSLSLSEDDVLLAELIGLLHDIGRFEQAKQYNTFNDAESFDHASYGVELLLKDKYISSYVDDIELQQIIIKAVENHNKFKIEPGLDRRTLMFCQIIRDADKLDILDVHLTKGLVINSEMGKISVEVMNRFLNSSLINHRDCKSEIDRVLTKFAYVYDLNFSYSANYIIENNIMMRLMEKVIANVPSEEMNLNQILVLVQSELKRKGDVYA